jgi:hypothetical protein
MKRNIFKYIYFQYLKSKRMYVLLAVSLVFIPSATLSQDVTRDPFTPPSILERVDIADQDRVRRLTNEIVQEQMISAERRLTQETIDRIAASERGMQQNFERVVSSVDSLSEKVDSIDETYNTRMAVISEQLEELQARPNIDLEAMLESGALSSLQTGQSNQASSPTSSLGTFIACVNGRAMYRDESGSTFFSEVLDAFENSDRCGG